MKKFLVVGFDAFGGEDINPSQVVVNKLPEKMNHAQIFTAILPTVFGKSAERLSELLKSIKPEVLLVVGLEAGSAELRLERVALNLDDASMPDNCGAMPTECPIVPNGPNCYLSNLPLRAIVNDLEKAGFPATISNTAGTFVGNHVFYSALHLAATAYPRLKVGFLHIPYLPCQTIGKPQTPSMASCFVLKALKRIICKLAK